VPTWLRVAAIVFDQAAAVAVGVFAGYRLAGYRLAGRRRRTARAVVAVNPEDEPPGAAYAFLLALTRPPDPIRPQTGRQDGA